MVICHAKTGFVLKERVGIDGATGFLFAPNIIAENSGPFAKI